MSSSHKSIKMFLNTEKSFEKPKTYPCESNSSEIARKMSDFFADGKMCDVTLIAKGENIKIKAHRIVLAASSEYFQAMFAGSLKEAKAEEVEFDQLDGLTLKMVITSIYSNSIELQTNTVENILKAGHLFQLKALEVTCCDFMKNHLEPSNCLGIAMFAEQYNYIKLYEDSYAFALKNFIKVRDCEEFLLLEIDQRKRLLSNDDLRIPSEKEVFHSLMSWIKHGLANREKYIMQLVKCVRLTLIQPRSIADLIEEKSKSSEWKEWILSAYKWHLLCGFQHTLLSEGLTKLRCPDDVVVAVSGWNNTKGVLNVGLYYSECDDWIYTVWPGMPEQRTGFASARVDGKLFIAGGCLYPSGTISNHVDCLDLRTLKWTKSPPMIVPRHLCKMTTLNGKLYVFGGNADKNGYFGEELDPLQAHWG